MQVAEQETFIVEQVHALGNVRRHAGDSHAAASGERHHTISANQPLLRSADLAFICSFTMSEPEPTTYNDMYQSVKEISSGLRHLGLGKDGWSDEDGKERVGVYADTRYVLRSFPPLQTMSN